MIQFNVRSLVTIALVVCLEQGRPESGYMLGTEDSKLVDYQEGLEQLEAGDLQPSFLMWCLDQAFHRCDIHLFLPLH